MALAQGPEEAKVEGGHSREAKKGETSGEDLRRNGILSRQKADHHACAVKGAIGTGQGAPEDRRPPLRPQWIVLAPPLPLLPGQKKFGPIDHGAVIEVGEQGGQIIEAEPLPALSRKMGDRFKGRVGEEIGEEGMNAEKEGLPVEVEAAGEGAMKAIEEVPDISAAQGEL
jgi:hypothetical protein